MSEQKVEARPKAAGKVKKQPPAVPPKQVDEVKVGGQAIPVVEVEGKEKKPAAKKVSKAGVQFTLLKEVSENEKMPLQEKQILKLLAAAPDKTMNREALLTAMKPVITTRQPIERILGFYQSRMVAGNWVKISSVVKVEAAAPKTESGDTQASEAAALAAPAASVAPVCE